MSAPMRKHPIEVHVNLGGKMIHYRGIPPKSVRPILKALEGYKDDSVDWRVPFEKDIAKVGSEAAYAVQSGRKMSGLGQVEFSKRLGIAQPHLSAIENGRRPVGKKLAKKLGKLLNLDYRVFL
jgi:ribosome-binding protein aMBF1 (putative translation factor)